MPRIVIGLFSRREDADAARRALVAAGIEHRRITLEEAPPSDTHVVGRPLPEDAGLAGFIRRMFSGAMLDHEGVDRYLLAAGEACCLVAVHEIADDELAEVRALLAAHGAIGPRASANGPRPRPATPHDEQVAQAAVGRFGPDVFPLPNAPTGWREPRRLAPNTIGEMPNDPARPEGLSRDAQGLGVDADRARIGRDDARARDRPHARPDDGSDKLHGDPLAERLKARR